VHLSILIATHRHGLLASSRIAQACSWANPDVEVIVRDNSGNAEKRALLPRFQRDNCKIILADPCDALTNFLEILKVAKGDFIFLLADDDFCFDHAVAAIPGLIDQQGKDPTVVGVTGFYALETSRGSTVVEYKNVDSEDVDARLAGYLSFGGPNVLQYAPVRRMVVRKVFDFIRTMPAFFSFHDQIVSLLYLLNGKFVRLNRLLYLYDYGVWETNETAQKRDVDFYREAGLDPAINVLHWFICGFEGAVLARNSVLLPNCSPALRQIVADRWFSSMFVRFKGNLRLTFGSPFAEEGERLRAKLVTSTGQLSFQRMLIEITGFMSLLSESYARRYFEFWSAAMDSGRTSQDRTPLSKASA
jgi:hypothetical protein